MIDARKIVWYELHRRIDIAIKRNGMKLDCYNDRGALPLPQAGEVNGPAAIDQPEAIPLWKPAYFESKGV